METDRKLCQACTEILAGGWGGKQDAHCAKKKNLMKQLSKDVTSTLRMIFHNENPCPFLNMVNST